MRLHLSAEDLDASLEDDCARALQRIPSAVQEVSHVKVSAVPVCSASVMSIQLLAVWRVASSQELSDSQLIYRQQILPLTLVGNLSFAHLLVGAMGGCVQKCCCHQNGVSSIDWISSIADLSLPACLSAYNPTPLILENSSAQTSTAQNVCLPNGNECQECQVLTVTLVQGDAGALKVDVDRVLRKLDMSSTAAEQSVTLLRQIDLAKSRMEKACNVLKVSSCYRVRVRV